MARQLLAVVDAGLCGIVFIAPYFLGGRHDLGRLVFVFFTVVAAGAWFTRQALLPSARWARTAAHGLILMAIGLLILQIVPLPTAWIDTLAPRTAELLPLWTGGSATVQLGDWQTLSLVPHETVKSLAMLISYSLLFVVVAQRIRDTADVRRLLRWIALAAVLMAGFGLVQFLASNGRFFWFYEHPYRTTLRYVTGSFANRNHCAQFLVLGVGPLVAWLVAATRTTRGKTAHQNAAVAGRQTIAYLLAAATAIVTLAILMTLSRGGAVALAVAATVIAVLYWRRRLVDRRHLYGLATLVSLVVAMLSLYGYDQVVARLDDFMEGSINVLDPAEGRRLIWRSNAAAIQAGWLTGAGAGSHREIYPVYLHQPLAGEFTHAENGYLQVATENGLPGAVLLLVGIGLCGYWCIGCYCRADGDEELLLCGATAASIAASTVHSFVDFVWYIPACLSLTIIMAACTMRLLQLALPAEDRRRARYVPGRLVWAASASIVLLAGAWTVHTFAGPAVAAIHWDRYLRAAIDDARISRQLLATFPSNYDASVTHPQQPLSDAMIHQLEQVVYWDPECARAHARLADRYMTQFELRLRDEANTMEISQIRDAAVASAFGSPEELRGWLDRAFGADSQLLYQALAHARKAVELCPLQGEGYLYLADLCFLEGGSYETVYAFVDQGLRVRPYDKGVLYRAGVQALSLGRLDETLRLWSKCYHVRGSHQPKIIYRLVASGMPASAFVTTFQPDWQTLRQVWSRYRQFGTDDDLRDLLTYTVKVTAEAAQQEHGECPDALWYWQSLIYADAGQADEALACLQRAYAYNPREYVIRYALARSLLAAGRYAEAEPHVRWCLARRPEDKKLGAALVEITKRRLAESELKESRSPTGIGGWRQ
jgi:O-antigen ligase/tetratricopeptide (TPR) repeat protein